jgi:hypothetical protein
MTLKHPGNPNWRKGVSGNPWGRPRARIDGEKVQERERIALRTMAEFVIDNESDFSEPVQILNAFARCTDVPSSLRIAAAAAAAPYTQPKLLPIPAPQYVYSPIEVPDFESIDQAESFLLSLSQRVGAAELEVQSANEIFARIREWINLRRNGVELELKRLAADATNADQVIRIEGGLPDLPGTNIIMPAESVELDTQAIEATPAKDVDNSPDVLQPIAK